jgi:hypothetical protein
MFYAKFVDNKFVASTNTLPEEEGYLEVADDSLIGKILIKETTGIIREQNEAEIQKDFDNYVLANKARYMINKATSMLKDSEELLKNDVWEQYTKEQKDSVTAYRANLKAVQEQKDFSKDVVWPEKPTFN